MEPLLCMNVLLLHSSKHTATPWRDGSTRYRCYHLAEALLRLGHTVDVCSVNEVSAQAIARYDVMQVLRPTHSAKLNRLLAIARKKGVHCTADVDDLIFVPDLASRSPRVLNCQASEHSIRQQFHNNVLAMRKFDEVTTATETLAIAWRDLHTQVPVLVVPNGLSEHWLRTLGHTSNQAEPASGKRVRITYLPGTSSHDRDFAQILRPLSVLLHQHPAVELLIVGSLAFDESPFPTGAVRRAPWTDYENLPALIANSHLTLAPLEDTPFTQAKSHIKFMESAAFGTPIICSPIEDITRHKVPGLHIATTEEDWLYALDNLVQRAQDADSSNVLEQCDSMKSYVEEHCLATACAGRLASHWTNVLFERYQSHAA